MRIKYLSAEEILRLHFQVIEDYGGSHGVREKSRLKSVIEAPKLVAFGEEQYSTAFEKASVYLRNIIGYYPFIDGNKRTALTVGAVFLRRNGYKITAKPKAFEDFTIKIATDHHY